MLSRSAPRSFSDFTLTPIAPHITVHETAPLQKSPLFMQHLGKHKTNIYADTDQMMRLFTNIIANAVEAMNGKGRLYFRTRDLDENIEIVMGNTGSFIHEEIRTKLFEPFYTRGKKGGTGLGLAICRKIVDLHEGQIFVSGQQGPSVEDDVTEFIIHLPAIIAEAAVSATSLIYHSDELSPLRLEKAAHAKHGDDESLNDFMRLRREREDPLYLLIVDDEPLFRETIRNLLKLIPEVADDVKVIECGSADEALKVLAERRFEYVITDIDLGRGRMNGYDLTAKVLDEYPNIFVLIHSNKRRDELDRNIREIMNDRFLGFLSKPMKRSELLRFLACKTFDSSQMKASPRQEHALKKVLILNDDDNLLVSFKIMLKSPNIVTFTAITVREALEYLERNRIDIILSDINLGDHSPSGYDFLRLVRETPVAT